MRGCGKTWDMMIAEGYETDAIIRAVALAKYNYELDCEVHSFQMNQMMGGK